MLRCSLGLAVWCCAALSLFGQALGAPGQTESLSRDVFKDPTHVVFTAFNRYECARSLYQSVPLTACFASNYSFDLSLAKHMIMPGAKHGVTHLNPTESYSLGPIAEVFDSVFYFGSDRMPSVCWLGFVTYSQCYCSRPFRHHESADQKPY